MSILETARGARERLKRAWSHRPGLPLSLALVSAAALVIVGALWLGDLLGERTTLGTIVVGSPAIYTRERLVNDRFLQDAWLSAQLEPPSGIQDSLALRSERRAGTLRAGEPKESGGAGERPGEDPRSLGQSGPLPRLSSRARLLEEVDYREIVRSLTIENQLDDRHDLNGNSLYRFKFDASVLPGTNTQASALIKVRLISPAFLAHEPDKTSTASLSTLGSPGDVAAWRGIYSRWIENLRSRLNQTHNELKQGFHNNEFSHNDYAHLIAFLARNLNVVASQVSGCSRQVEDLRGPERLGVRLSTEEHVARKQCIEAMVERTVPTKVIAGPLPRGAALGVYIAELKDIPRTEQADSNRSRRIHDTVELWLNSFFASKTVKLVLGLAAIPETSFIQRTLYDIPAFRNLARLTFFNGDPEATDGHFVFDVTEKVFSVAAIDPRKVTTKDHLLQISQTDDRLGGHTLEDFIVPVGSARPERLRVSRRSLETVKDEPIVFSEEEFRDVSSGKGFYLASAEVGLLNFVNAARQNVVAFTYGVTPKESADSIDVTLSTDSRVEGHTPAGSEAGAAAAQLRREATFRTLERRNAVVGFAGVARDARSAEFGWVISPRLASLDGMRHAYVQMPAQYALSALVSIPSWWSKARFHVTTSWLGRNGLPIERTAMSTEYAVDVPMDFEPLEALLLGIEQLGPELMESRLDGVVLTACRAGAIVIPGRRLWRSTKVTLGYQTADSISVLPNMKGIIAKFHTVQNQMSLEEEMALRKKGGDGVEIQRTVRVWTSQGSLTLPRPATIGVPAGTSVDCVAPPPEKPGVSAKSAVSGK
jgi:hypothetical protein